MKHFLFFLLLVPALYNSFGQCPTPGVAASGPTSFCPGGSVTLSAPVSGNTWTDKAAFGGSARYGAVGFAIGSKGYVGTGYDGGVKNDFWEYDQASDVWTQKAGFGGAGRINAVGFSTDGKGYVGLGGTVVGNHFSDFWEYDPAANAWAKKADYEGAGRINAVGFAIGGKGYVGTGYDGGAKNDFWEYDPATNVWIRKADFGGTARAGAVGFAIGSKGYVGTGYDGNDRTDFWEYDPSANNWTKKADFGGTRRRYAIGFGIGSKGYIGLGNNMSGSNRNFWEYDQATDVWTQKMDFGGAARSGAVGFAIGAKGYVGTGNNGSKLTDFWAYDPGYTYAWSPGGATTSAIDVTAIGNYTVTVTDATGCSAVSAATSVNVKTPAIITNQPADVTICTSRSASMQVGVSTTATPAPSIQWQVSTNGGSSWTNAATPVNGYVSTLTLQFNGAAVYRYRAIATNECGADTSDVATLTVNGKPVLDTLLSSFTSPTNAASCSAIESLNATATGAPAPSISYAVEGSPITFPYSFPLGTTVVTITAANGCGTDTKTVSITVKDTAPPFFTPPAARDIYLGTDCSIVVPDLTSGQTGSDNCGVVTFVQAPAAGTIISSGNNQTQTVTITADDGRGNTTSHDVSLAVKDTTLPTVTAPAAIRVNTDAGKCNASIALVTPAYSDNCSGATISNDAPTIFPKGSTTVTWTARDAAGNTATATQMVTVQDNEKPVVTCPVVPATLCNAAGGTYAIAPLQATDNCGIASTTYAITGVTSRSGNGMNANGVFNPGTSTITWTVQDESGNMATCQTVVVVNPAVTVSMPDAKVLSSGVEVNTVYIGYASASALTLTATVSGGSGMYNYKWSTGATTAAIKVSPIANTTYTVTVTDAKGCTATASKQVKVVNISCGGGKNTKVLVCHSGNSLCIDSKDVSDHLTHGDYIGNCRTGNGMLTKTMAAKAIPTEVTTSLTAQVAPNPSATYFTLAIRSNSNKAVSLQVVDAVGRIVEGKSGIAATGTLRIGYGYRPGVYYAQVVQGSERKTIMLIKQ